MKHNIPIHAIFKNENPNFLIAQLTIVKVQRFELQLCLRTFSTNRSARNYKEVGKFYSPKGYELVIITIL